MAVAKKQSDASGAPLHGEVDPVVVGQRVKALREAMQLSLRDLAERSGVSAPMLSQVERGETSPTLSVAARIARGLDLTLSQLLRLDEAAHVVIVTKDQRRQGPSKATGHRYEMVTPPLPGQRVMLSVHTLDPGASTGGEGDSPIHEPGSRETLLVEKGALDLMIDGERRTINEGDSVTFDADLPHHFENPTKSATTFLAVTAAGLRRS
ncbi:MAG: helix-turn-helix transcriptional regulator [Solirubrobacterales bacterium]|nr:helix-turn-helix transcriptional regulator [Solirubrobacterales bacterium]